LEKKFKVSGLDFKNNQIPLGQIYSPEIDCFAYGKNEGKCSIEFVLSNPWFFKAIMGTAVTVDVDGGGGGTLYSHTWNSDPSVDATMRDINSMALQIGVSNTNDILRLPVGIVCASLAFKMTINETVKCT